MWFTESARLGSPPFNFESYIQLLIPSLTTNSTPRPVLKEWSPSFADLNGKTIHFKPMQGLAKSHSISSMFCTSCCRSTTGHFCWQAHFSRGLFRARPVSLKSDDVFIFKSHQNRWRDEREQCCQSAETILAILTQTSAKQSERGHGVWWHSQLGL